MLGRIPNIIHDFLLFMKNIFWGNTISGVIYYWSSVVVASERALKNHMKMVGFCVRNESKMNDDHLILRW